MSARYCEVALPVPLRRLFTYALPAPLEPLVRPGSRVVVPFRNRVLVGVALGVSDSQPPMQKLKAVLDVPDILPALTESLTALGRWVAEYYLAPPGEVFRAILPPPVEVRRDRQVAITNAGRELLRQLGESACEHRGTERAERTLLEGLAKAGGAVSGARLTRLTRGEGMEAALETLASRQCIQLQVSAARRRGRSQTILAWRDDAVAEDEAENQLAELLKAAGALPLADAARQAGMGRAAIATLVRKGKLKSWQEPLGAGPEAMDAAEFFPIHQLTAGQAHALEEIDAWLDAGGFHTGLLYGATGSGKTEVYMRAVERALARLRGAILLVPEIALTFGVGRQARARFGDRVAVLHSGLPDAERAREWWRVRRGEASVVVATRLGVFAPVPNLGLLVVDEEQESSYKQEETPRYNARDTAVMRGKLEGATVLLGSATPSLESFHHARQAKYRLLEVGGRVENRPLAEVEVIDLRSDFRQQQRVSPVSRPLRESLGRCLERGAQALLLINRRGYAWFVLCRACGATLECANCSIALTYHKRRDRLLCHYCGYSIRIPPLCPKCRSEHLYYYGEGAERIEEYLREQFSRARVARLDRDTARTRQAYRKVLGAFAGGELDVLVGTQMVAKGHDFQRVTLVGVLGADRSLAVPDFRAAERTFQLLTQVAGRAGRGALAGRVLVETYHPDHYAIQHAARQDYPGFFEQELRFRRLMQYPPFSALANVVVRDRNLDRVVAWTRALAEFFARSVPQGLKVMGPAPAPLARLRREHRYQFLLKSSQRSLLGRTLAGAMEFCGGKEIPEAAVLVDVDPVSLL